MFEDALFESNGRLRTHRGWLSGVAAIGNCVFVCILLLLPLLHPASLPRQALSTLLAAPPQPALPVVPATRPASVATRPAASLNNDFENRRNPKPAALEWTTHTGGCGRRGSANLALSALPTEWQSSRRGDYGKCGLSPRRMSDELSGECKCAG
jgi:hypothetical protein